MITNREYSTLTKVGVGMTKKKKRIIAVISITLCVALLCSVFGGVLINAFGATNGISEGVRWYLDDDGVFTVNLNTNAAETHNGYGANYTSSSQPWNLNRSKIKKVIVEDGVKAIGDYWFSSCTKLEEVTLPDSLVKLGAYCFSGCSSLTGITIPESCTELYRNTFQNCSKLKWAVLPGDCSAGTAHQLPNSFFYGCSALENVWAGSGINSFAASCFRNCSNLKSVIWTGSSISSIGSYFPSGVTFVGNSSIGSWCSSNGYPYVSPSGSCGDGVQYSFDLDDRTLTVSGSGEMESSPWTLWRYFVGGLELGNVSLICENAFQGCENLSGVMNVPESVEVIGNFAFSNTGYKYYNFDYSSEVDIDSLAFDGDKDLVFYGIHGNGISEFVFSYSSGNWKYYCADSHHYNANGQCTNCDRTFGYDCVDALGNHDYIYQYRLGDSLCFCQTDTGEADIEIDVHDLLNDFDYALSTDDGAQAYSQSNYDGRFDICRDGYVNAKDYGVMKEMASGAKTDYDMTLSNPNATESTKALYAYIASIYGSKILSGQQESTWVGGSEYEMNYIYNETGKYPAIRGLDFMGDDFNGCVSRARSWAARGGIVSICWHCSSAFDQSYDACKADEFTAAQWEAVLTEGTTEHAAFLQGMRKAGNALLQLQNEGIPVLWRPFHEFDGAWFWWGKGGSDCFKRLWIMMYNYYTYDLGLNNLIWVLGYSHNGTEYGANLADWYPGSQYCDITGADSYKYLDLGGNVLGAEVRLYNGVNRFVNGAKPLALHETGLIPTVEQLEKVPWVYFLTWHTTYLTSDNPTTNLNTVYNSSYVITLDELPDFY